DAFVATDRNVALEICLAAKQPEAVLDLPLDAWRTGARLRSRGGRRPRRQQQHGQTQQIELAHDYRPQTRSSGKIAQWMRQKYEAALGGGKAAAQGPAPPPRVSLPRRSMREAEDGLFVFARAHAGVGEDAVVGDPPEGLLVDLLAVRLEHEPFARAPAP